MASLEGFVKKGWGHELIFATNDLYCGKIMHFDKKGAKSSMHFHAKKDETWYVAQGSFLLRLIDTKTSQITQKVLKKGETWRNKPLEPHQVESLEDDSQIFEVSSKDTVEDNYRVMPGDSQL